MPNPVGFQTPLGQKIPVKFYDPLNANAIFSPAINPTQIPRKPGNVRKYAATVNATSVIIGDRESPPAEIRLIWKTIDKADYDGIRAWTSVNPLVFVDNNDNGFLGVLMIESAEQLAGMSYNVWAVTAVFLVIAPYKGSSTTINTLTAPILSYSVAGSAGGYIPNNTTLYFWSTVWTPWGESAVGPTTVVTTGAGANTNYIGLTYIAPSSNYFRKLRIYWNTSTNSATSTMLTEVLSGLSASFTVYSPYVQYNTINPPTYSTGFTGYFAGGAWVNDT